MKHYWHIHWRNGGTAYRRRGSVTAGWAFRDWISEPRKGSSRVLRRGLHARLTVRRCAA